MNNINHKDPDHYSESVACDNCGAHQLYTGADVSYGGFLCPDCLEELEQEQSANLIEDEDA